MSQRPLAHRIGTLLLVGIIAGTLLRLLDRIQTPIEPVLREPVERPDLVRWEMPGCYALRVDPWEWLQAPDAGDPAVPFLTPPSRVRLLPDSTDKWRRSRTTYRAVPITGDHDARVADYLRWVVRADTLWLLWSDGRAGAGIALRLAGDSLLGRARSFDRVRELDGTARAAAWRLNCHTLERETREDRPRR